MSHKPELAGELLLATNANGDFFRFSFPSRLHACHGKTADDRWQIDLVRTITSGAGAGSRRPVVWVSTAACAGRTITLSRD